MTEQLFEAEREEAAKEFEANGDEFHASKLRDLQWLPFCLRCSTVARMERRHFGFRCVACHNTIGFNLQHITRQQILEQVYPGQGGIRL